MKQMLCVYKETSNQKMSYNASTSIFLLSIEEISNYITAILLRYIKDKKFYLSKPIRKLLLHDYWKCKT